MCRLLRPEDVVSTSTSPPPLGLRWGRIGIAVVLGEAIPIAGLFILVSLYSFFVADSVARSPDQFARIVGSWVGPIAGAIAAFAMSNWAGKAVPHIAVRQALIIGAAIAGLDIAILAMTSREMGPLFLFSNAEKFAAALLGGVFAAIRENPLPR